MATIDTLRRLQAFKRNPSVIKPPDNEELADLVLEVMLHVQAVNKMVAEGKVKGDSGETPQPDVHYLAIDTAKKQLGDAIKKFEKDISAKGVALEGRVRKALEDIRNGDDGIVTEEEIERASQLAYERLQALLPNFTDVATTAITASPQAIRDALELLQDDERLSAKSIHNITIEDVNGLREALEQIRDMFRKIPVGGAGGGASRNFVIDYVAQNASSATPYTPVETTGTTFTGNGGTPKYVIMNGITYFEGHGYTFTGNTVTTDYALEADGFIRIFY